MKKLIWNIFLGVTVLLNLGVIGIVFLSYNERWVIENYSSARRENETTLYNQRWVNFYRGGVDIEQVQLGIHDQDRDFLGKATPVSDRFSIKRYPRKAPIFSTANTSFLKSLISFKKTGNNQLSSGTASFYIYSSIIFPIWVFMVPLAPFNYLAGRRVIRWKRNRRKNRSVLAGLCGNCGYDLRASPTRCPECGREREG